jgi:hypothetical protein
MMFILSVIILMAFFLATYFIFADKITTTDTQALLLIGTAYGAVATNAGNVVSYWFGTSKSSADKDATIKTLNEKENP